MVRQLNGQYKIRNENLKKYFQQAQTILKTADYRAAFRHVMREQNSEADALANRGIDQKIPLTTDFRIEQE
jgi:ribonuclease HI